jgi:hypothetical protein
VGGQPQLLPATAVPIARCFSLLLGLCEVVDISATLLYASPQGSMPLVPTSSPAFSPLF